MQIPAQLTCPWDVLMRSGKCICAQDSQEDGRAVSAEALLPVAASLSSHGGPAVQDIQRALWETLDEVDDLSACAGNSMWGLFILPGDKHV